jgi:hypothetical protein
LEIDDLKKTDRRGEDCCHGSEVVKTRGERVGRLLDYEKGNMLLDKAKRLRSLKPP